jgi:hypothetical protein
MGIAGKHAGSSLQALDDEPGILCRRDDFV